jgi:hypothetical protein
VNGPAGALAYYSFFKKFISNVSFAMIMQHFLCDGVGGKHNVCGMALNQKKHQCQSKTKLLSSCIYIYSKGFFISNNFIKLLTIKFHLNRFCILLIILLYGRLAPFNPILLL